MNTAVQSKTLLPDLVMAQRYLTLLDETAESFVFQTFDDDKQRKNKGLAAIREGSLSQHSQTLTRANAAGAGVFVTVNKSDGKGRKLENITRIRAVWHEEDTPHTKPFPIEQHFSIESSPGKFHHYWLVDDLSQSDFAGVMECLIQVYGSDPNVKDTARVLRLPGFYHQKDPSKPFMVRIIHESGGRAYSREQILAAFPLMKKVHKASTALPLVAPDGEATDGHKALAASLAAKAAAATHADHTKGRHSQVLWLGRECAHKGVPQSAGPYALQCFAKLMRQTDTTGAIAPLNFEAELKAFNDAYAKGLENPPSPWHGGERREYGDYAETGRPAHTLSAVESIEAENTAKKEWEAKIDASDDFAELTVTFFTAIENSTLREPTKAALAKRIAKAAEVSVGSLKEGFRRDEPPERTPQEEKWVRELNKKHAIVTQGGSTKIMNTEVDPHFNRVICTFCPSESSFVLRYKNKPIHGYGDVTTQGEAWIIHPERREYDAIAFMPGHDLGPRTYNLWHGFQATPIDEGSCSKSIAFIRTVICMDCKITYTYIMNYLAHLVQRPWELAEVAIVMRGLQGTGKNTFMKIIQALIGCEHYVELTQMAHLTGQFSAQRAGALVIFANEALWGGNKQDEGTYKALVSDSLTMLERKHVDASQIKNFARVFVGSNHPFPVVRDEDDRRHVVLDVLATHKEEGDYFAAIENEIINGGADKLMYMLMNRDIKGWHPRRIPLPLLMRGWDMKIRSGTSIIEWYFECLEDGFIAHEGEDYARTWKPHLLTQTCHDVYSAWCRKRNRYVENRETLGTALLRWGCEKRRESYGYRPNYYKFPEQIMGKDDSLLDAARRAFCTAIKMPTDYWNWKSLEDKQDDE